MNTNTNTNTKTKTRRRKKNVSITFNEFVSWLQGIEDISGDDWVPNSEQWKKIKDKIKTVKIEEENVSNRSSFERPRQQSPYIRPNSQFPINTENFGSNDKDLNSNLSPTDANTTESLVDIGKSAIDAIQNDMGTYPHKQQQTISPDAITSNEGKVPLCNEDGDSLFS